MGRLVLIALLGASCGRFGFGDVPKSTGGGVDATTTPDALSLLACTGPTRFQTGAATVTMTATAGANGYSAFTVDGNGDLAGFGYTFDATALTTAAQDVAIDTNATGNLGAATNGSTVMLAAATGLPSSTGTKLYALADDMTNLAAPSLRDGELLATTPIVASPVDNGFALFTINGSEMDANHVAPDGSDAGGLVAVVPSAEAPGYESVTPVPNGYAIGYASARSSPRQATLELVDATTFAITAGPVAVDNAQYDEYDPVIAAVGTTYLVAWHAKDVTDDDDIWFELRDASLAPIGMPQQIATFSHVPVVASDGTSFFLVWDDYKPSDHLAGVQVMTDGTTTPISVLNTGGTPVGWAMATRGPQPVLVWIESGGTGPDLYLNPMCGP